MFLFLAITDIGVTAFVQPMYVAANISGLFGKRSCILWDVIYVSSVFFQGLSLATIVILSLQSYVTLAYPNRYQSIITKPRVIVVFFSFGFFVAISDFLVFLHQPFTSFMFVVILCSAIITVVFTWIWTYKLIARHQSVIRSTQTPVTRQNVTRKKVVLCTGAGGEKPGVCTALKEGPKINNYRFCRYFKSAGMLFVCFGLFLFSYSTNPFKHW